MEDCQDGGVRILSLFTDQNELCGGRKYFFSPDAFSRAQTCDSIDSQLCTDSASDRRPPLSRLPPAAAKPPASGRNHLFNYPAGAQRNELLLRLITGRCGRTNGVRRTLVTYQQPATIRRDCGCSLYATGQVKPISSGENVWPISRPISVASSAHLRPEAGSVVNKIFRNWALISECHDSQRGLVWPLIGFRRKTGKKNRLIDFEYGGGGRGRLSNVYRALCQQTCLILMI